MPIRPKLPIFRLVIYSVLGTLCAFLLVVGSIDSSKPTDWILAGSGPSWTAIHQDFPQARQPSDQSLGHDGKFFYVIARDPFHITKTAKYLDRPRYRYQRPLFPILAWALHPSGGGTGLVVSMVFVGLAALLLGGFASGALSTTLGGPSIVAVLFPLLGGSFISLRLSVADALAVALAVAALVLFLRDHTAFACLAASAAVLSKEPILLIFLSLLLWKRTRSTLLLASIPTAVAASWWIALKIMLSSYPTSIQEFNWPFFGITHAIRYWFNFSHLNVMLWVVLAIGVGIFALCKTSRSHILWWPVATQLVFLVVLKWYVIGQIANGPRTTLPLLVLGGILLLTPSWRPIENAATDVPIVDHPAR